MKTQDGKPIKVNQTYYLLTDLLGSWLPKLNKIKLNKIKTDAYTKDTYAEFIKVGRFEFKTNRFYKIKLVSYSKPISLIELSKQRRGAIHYLFKDQKEVFKKTVKILKRRQNTLKRVVKMELAETEQLEKKILKRTK